MTVPPLHMLIIGNSHVGAVRLAYAAAPGRWPGVDALFLGLPGWNMADLTMDGGILRPLNDKAAVALREYNQIEELDLSDFAAFAVVGGHAFRHSARFVTDHVCPDLPSAGGASARRQLVSRDFLTRALAERLGFSAANRVHRRLSALGRPMIMAPEPMPSADCRAAPDDYGDYLDLVDRGDHSTWTQIYRAVWAETLGADTTVLDWPAAALVDGAFTRTDLMRGSMTLLPSASQRHPDGEYAHANAAYGALVMDQIAAAAAGLQS